MQKIVFFSHIYLEKFNINKPELPQKNFSGLSISRYESGFLAALKVLDEKMICINSPFYRVPSFFEKAVSIKEFSFKNEAIQVINLGYENTKIHSLFFKDFPLKKQIERLPFEKNNEIIFVLSTHHDISVTKSLKRRFPNSKTILLLPDIPQLFVSSTKTSLLYRVKTEIHSFVFENNLKYIDYLIPITRFIPQEINFPEEKSLTIESVTDYQANKESRKPQKYIAYLGSLKKAYGVMDLIEAFNSTDLKKSFKLLIFGGGDCVEEIQNIAKNNPSIIFKGTVSYKESIEAERNAFLLVVPPNRSNVFEKYSFHSKICEYMVSETPVLCSFYPGIPSNYQKYVWTIPNGDRPVREMADSLVKYCSIPEEENIRFGKEAAIFLKKTRSPKAVAYEIKNFISKK